MITPKLILLVIALAPLFGAIVAGLFGRQVGRAGAHTVTIAGVAVSFLLSCYVLYQESTGGWGVFNENLYTWFEIGPLSAHVGFLVDRLTAVMMVVVTSVSLLVHIYTIGYMHEDPGYQRFFSYISLFTFSMLMLVMSQQFHAAVLRLGSGRRRLVPADRLLVHQAADGDLREPEGLPGQPRRRLRLRARHRRQSLYYTGSLDYAEVFRSAAPKYCPARRIDVLCLDLDRVEAVTRDLRAACSSARWASPRRCRCTSGCRTRWKAPRRSRH